MVLDAGQTTALPVTPLDLQTFRPVSVATKISFLFTGSHIILNSNQVVRSTAL